MRYSTWYKRLWRRFLWLPLPYYLYEKPSDPNFLFSLPPYVEWGGYTWMVVMNWRDDPKRTSAASERLRSVGGGIMRRKPGQFINAEDFE